MAVRLGTRMPTGIARVTQHVRERAYVLWRQEGCPTGRADEYWRRAQDFEAD